MSTLASPRIESARPDDLESDRTLLANSSLPVDDVDAALLADFQVARGVEGVLGVMGLQRAGDAALLRSLAVTPQARGLGLGAALVDAAEAAAATNRIATLFLLTTSAAPYFASRLRVR